MLTLIIMIAVLYMLCGLVSLILRASFGIFKVLFSVGLFFCCPVLFLIALACGLLHSGWFWILLLVFVCLGGRRRAF